MKTKPEARSQTPEVGNRKPEAGNPSSAFCPPPSVLRPPASERGVALIITLILLAVVTFMALTFLAISRRERGAVTTATDTAAAQLAADDALAAAEGQIVASMVATTNPYNFGLLVSTNYINPLGFQNAGLGYASYTNVNYYYPNGNPLLLNDFLQNLGNLYYLPRPPVFVPSPPDNYSTPTNWDFRFYLDLNRNGTNDANGLVPEIGNNGLPIVNGGVTNYVSETGDPEWIGVLQHPDQPYGPNNPFVARYAFIAVPIGNALDLNAIYNQVRDEGQAAQNGRIRMNPSSFGPGIDSYLRNQGVGSWEINLAAFLADLNTNQWLPTMPPNVTYYWYLNQPYPNYESQGAAFNDARALLAYRYQNNYLSLKPASRFFSNSGTLRFDNIDQYSDGPLQTGPSPINEVNFPGNRDDPTLPWAGAPNTNQFFDSQELFNPNESSIAFTNHLVVAGGGPSSYNRYTFYRLLSQMGVESAPEQNKLNLNYVNVDANGNVVPDMETNLIPWTALQFFTNAADRMLQAYSQEWMVANPSNYVATYGSFTNISTAANSVLNPTNMPLPFGISHIPVYVNGNFVYSPSVQRVLQLAANIYDATTNNTAVMGMNFPSVFRPIFNLVPIHSSSGAIIYTNVYIVGYEPVGDYYDAKGQIELGTVTGPNDPQFLTLPVQVTDLLTLIPNIRDPFYPSPFGIYTNVNVYGVPWIIGAKKGFPHFNKFNMESAFQLTRKLQVTRLSTNDNYANNPGDFHFNQMFNLNISNQFGVECWNSYTNSFNDSVVIYVRDNLRHAALTNDEGFSADYPAFPIASNLQITAGFVWPGYNPVTDPLGSQLSFQIPLYTNVTVITNSTYIINGLTYNGITYPPRSLTTNQALPFETGVNINGNLYPQPHWFLTTSNEFQVFMLDTQTGPPYHVIDYVQLSGPDSYRDLTSEIITNYNTPINTAQASGSELWNTNFDQNGVPVGILSQVGVSMGLYTASSSSGTWNTTSPTQLANEIAGFSAFMGYTPPPPYGAGEATAIALGQTSLSNQAPYTPTAAVVQHISWQANDPLVHYLASDLNWGLNGESAIVYDRYVDSLMTNSPNGNLGQLNQSYRPWGGNWNLPNEDQNPYNLALKDPLVWQSDDWDFPSYKFPSVGWLGRVHRGTPWQTVYLKSPDILQQTLVSGSTTNYIGTNTWAQWTGDTLLTSSVNGQYYDAVNTAPAQDRLLFDIFTAAPNNNATLGQLSVNVDAGNPSPQAGLAAWSALFSGVIVLSNNAIDATIKGAAQPVWPLTPPDQHNGSLVNFTPFAINPAGPPGLNSALGQLVAGINQTRTNFVNPDGLVGSFEHVGDILAVPQLTWQSPFLNWNDTVQQVNGVSDEMYEWLPEQVMSLLHVSDTPRYVIYSYGQTLKPAPNGIYTGSGPYFGMVTNYQVVAEAATRAVIRFTGTRVNNVVPTNDLNGNYYLQVVPSVTNNNGVIEQFNVLPAN